MKDLPEAVLIITKKASDSGLLIEAGWLGFSLMAIPRDAPDIQVEEMRNAFFAGAQHLFNSILTVLDPDKEPTDDDMRRMAMINSELEEFIRQYKIRRGIA